MIFEYNGIRPQIAEDAFIAPTATIIGQVIIKEKASVWFGAVIRGDEGKIVIGSGTNVQDNAVIHVNHANDTIIEADVTIGHHAVMEGCHIKAGALIGMNATVLNGATIGERALVAAGSVVRENQEIPAETLAVGVPAIVKGPLTEAAQHHLARTSKVYVSLAETYPEDIRPIERNIE